MSRAIILPDRRVYAVSKAEERGQRRWRQSGPCLPSSASPASQSASQNAAADVLRPSRGVSESSRQPAVRPSSRRGDCRQGIKSRTAPANRRPIWPSARASVLGLQNLAHLEVSRIEPFACLGRQCICRAECACHSCSDPGFPSAACRFSLRQLSCFVSPPPFALSRLFQLPLPRGQTGLTTSAGICLHFPHGLGLPLPRIASAGTHFG